MKVEFFTAGCRPCERTLGAIRSRFPKLHIEIHSASD